MLFHPVPNQTLALSATSPPDEISLLPDLATLGSKQVNSRSKQHGNCCSIPSGDWITLPQGQALRNRAFCGQSVWTQSTNAIWCPASAPGHLGWLPGCLPSVFPPGFDEQHLIWRLQQSVLVTSIHSPSCNDFVNAAELWDWHKSWHSGLERRREAYFIFTCSKVEHIGTKWRACCDRTGLSAKWVQDPVDSKWNILLIYQSICDISPRNLALLSFTLRSHVNQSLPKW